MVGMQVMLRGVPEEVQRAINALSIFGALYAEQVIVDRVDETSANAIIRTHGAGFFALLRALTQYAYLSMEMIPYTDKQF